MMMPPVGTALYRTTELLRASKTKGTHIIGSPTTSIPIHLVYKLSIHYQFRPGHRARVAIGYRVLPTKSTLPERVHALNTWLPQVFLAVAFFLALLHFLRVLFRDGALTFFF